MKPLRLVCCLTLLFFALMAAVTVYTVGREYDRLPRVALAAAARGEDGSYLVPLSALHTNGDGGWWLLLVREEDGPWGKEYRCKRLAVSPPQPGPSPDTALVRGEQLDRWPVAAASDQPLGDGQRVRFQEEGAP